MSCSFTDLNKEVKTQVIQNCSSQQLRRKALREDMSLEELLSSGRSLEIADRHAEAMSEKKVEVMKVDRKTDLKCFKCGGHFPHKNKCPALGKKCNNCNSLNHFASVCKKFKQQHESARTITNEHQEVEHNDAGYMYGV